MKRKIENINDLRTEIFRYESLRAEQEQLIARSIDEIHKSVTPALNTLLQLSSAFSSRSKEKTGVVV